jgi:hypothetical protein
MEILFQVTQLNNNNMAWLAVDEDGDESIFESKPKRGDGNSPWWCHKLDNIGLPKGSIEKLIDKKLTWEDEPVEL